VNDPSPHFPSEIYHFKEKGFGNMVGAQTCLVISMAIKSAIPVPACKKVNISTVKKMHSLILMRTKENGDCLCSLQTVRLFSIVQLIIVPQNFCPCQETFGGY
jgi:hypothetical protein